MMKRVGGTFALIATRWMWVTDKTFVKVKAASSVHSSTWQNVSSCLDSNYFSIKTPDASSKCFWLGDDETWYNVEQTIPQRSSELNSPAGKKFRINQISKQNCVSERERWESIWKPRFTVKTFSSTGWTLRFPFPAHFSRPINKQKASSVRH